MIFQKHALGILLASFRLDPTFQISNRDNLIINKLLPRKTKTLENFGFSRRLIRHAFRVP